MPEQSPGLVTTTLADLRRGSPGAADRLARLVYDDLHQIALRALRREDAGHTLQPTELVSEAFIRLVDQREVSWQNRAHFYAIAARTLRRILIDHARARRAVKRDHGVRVTLDESIGDGASAPNLDLIALDDALDLLGSVAPRPAQVVEMRFFGGLEIEQTAEALGISPATVKRDWTFARAFLLRHMDASTP
jgi:RNA polymerase sigma factor (TIGR02999 family)